MPAKPDLFIFYGTAGPVLGVEDRSELLCPAKQHKWLMVICHDVGKSPRAKLHNANEDCSGMNSKFNLSG